jgi:small nuclear ribonucleoprotein (snRNP)-like protein
MLVELKNGETLNGHLVTCDTWMNLTLKEVVQTSPVCISFGEGGAVELSREGWTIRVIRTELLVTGWDILLTTGISQEGDKFFRLPEVYVKGNNVCHGILGI